MLRLWKSDSLSIFIPDYNGRIFTWLQPSIQTTSSPSFLYEKRCCNPEQTSMSVWNDMGMRGKPVPRCRSKTKQQRGRPSICGSPRRTHVWQRETFHLRFLSVWRSQNTSSSRCLNSSQQATPNTQTHPVPKFHTMKPGHARTPRGLRAHAGSFPEASIRHVNQNKAFKAAAKLKVPEPSVPMLPTHVHSVLIQRVCICLFTFPPNCFCMFSKSSRL